MSDQVLRAEGLNRMARQGGGLMRVHIVPAEDGPGLVAAAEWGDRFSLCLLRIITDSETRMRAAPKRRPVLCLTCPSPIRECRGVTFIVCLPESDDPRDGVASAVCRKCARHSDLPGTVIQRLRQHIWPGLRRIDVTHNDAGHA